MSRVGSPEILIFSLEMVIPENKISGGIFYPESPENSSETELHFTKVSSITKKNFQHPFILHGINTNSVSFLVLEKRFADDTVILEKSEEKIVTVVQKGPI